MIWSNCKNFPTKSKTQSRSVPGVAQLSDDQLGGQSQLQIEIDRARAARYGLNASDIQNVVETAVGGKAASQVVEGERKFDIVVRLNRTQPHGCRKYRRHSTSTRLTDKKFRCATSPILNVTQGYTYINREANQRRAVVRFDVRGRDLGGTIADAQKVVKDKIHLPCRLQISLVGTI